MVHNRLRHVSAKNKKTNTRKKRLASSSFLRVLLYLRQCWKIWHIMIDGIGRGSECVFFQWMMHSVCIPLVLASQTDTSMCAFHDVLTFRLTRLLCFTTYSVLPDAPKGRSSQLHGCKAFRVGSSDYGLVLPVQLIQ